MQSKERRTPLQALTGMRYSKRLWFRDVLRHHLRATHLLPN